MIILVTTSESAKKLLVLDRIINVLLKPFECIKTIAILVCKQVSSNSFKNEITVKLIFYLPTLEPFKFDEQDMRDIAEGVKRDVFLWTTTHERAGVRRPARTCLQHLYKDTGCCLEDLMNAMDDREKWRGRVREICADGMTWWWWWWWYIIYIYLNVCKQMTDVKSLLLHSNTWNHLTVYKQMINRKQNYSYLIAILETI